MKSVFGAIKESTAATYNATWGSNGVVDHLKNMMASLWSIDAKTGTGGTTTTGGGGTTPSPTQTPTQQLVAYAEGQDWVTTDLEQRAALAWQVRSLGVSLGLHMADLVNATGKPYDGWFQALGVPSFAVGANRLPSDMLAQVHEGERIVPAADNRELMQRLRDPQENSAALVAEIKALRDDNAAQARAMVQLQQRLTKLMERWDSTGMPDTRLEV